MQTNHRGVATKEPKVTVERIGSQTSITKGPYIHRATSEIMGTSKKTQNSPSTKGRGKELSTIVNGLANLETVQISNLSLVLRELNSYCHLRFYALRLVAKVNFVKVNFIPNSKN